MDESKDKLIQPLDQDGDIDFWGILDWLLSGWKLIIVSTLSGLLLGISSLIFLEPYEVRATVVTNGAVDFIGWRNLRSNLPILAGKVVRIKDLQSEEELKVFSRMTSPEWWSKNFVPTFAISKSDTKDMLPQSTDLRELGATKILNFILFASGKTGESAIRAAEIESQFFISGSTYFSLKTLLGSYESSVINDSANLQREISEAKVNLISLRSRAKTIKILADRYKDKASSSTTLQSIGNASQITAANLANSKFLPLSTQLIAIESDIDQATQTLELAQGRLTEIDFLRDFLMKVLPLLDRDLDGVKSTSEMLLVLNSQRQSISPDNLYALKKADVINADLTGVLTSFTKTLDINIPPTAKKKGILKLAVLGAFFGFILAIVILMFRSGYLAYKRRLVRGQS